MLATVVSVLEGAIFNPKILNLNFLSIHCYFDALLQMSKQLGKTLEN